MRGVSWVVGVVLWAGVAMGQAPTGRTEKKPTPGVMETYETSYYVVNTDLDIWAVREASVRLTAMFETYRERTKDFPGQINRKFPFYLYGRSQDYYAAGGIPGSAGQYTGRKLMAWEGGHGSVWPVVQHEGFHQFVDAVMQGEIPIWLNEGLAEYFGAGVWTGDGYVTGEIPPVRLKMVQKEITEKKMLNVLSMMMMTHGEWNGALSSRNYDQAWSMVHFLAHGDGGKYQKPFSAFIGQVSRGVPWDKAWVGCFGPDAIGFQKAYEGWWMSQTVESTEGKYIEATVQTLTSYLARAYTMGQKFPDAGTFLTTTKEGKLEFQMPEQWLPPALLERALKQAEELSEWSFAPGKTPPDLVLKTADGKTYRGTFKVNGKKIVKVETVVK